MEDQSRIIAIRKRDISLARQAFSELMHCTEDIMNEKARTSPESFRNINPSELETLSVNSIKVACHGSPFSPDQVHLISGHRFPDIVAENYYGVEVKQTNSNTWTSIGSSIVETTRVELVEDIYMLFGKLGGDVPEFKCRPYQDVLYDIAVTHSPRYMINMELDEKGTIFHKMGTTYDSFRKSADKISRVRQYFRELATRQKREEMPWWITNENMDKANSFNIRLWHSLDMNEKRRLRAKCMILFPEALNPDRNKNKYNNVTLWLCSCNQVVNPNIRDMFSAGGTITHIDGTRLDRPVAQVFNTIVEYADEIRGMLDHPDPELYLMIKEFNPTLLQGTDPYGQWLKTCCQYASRHNVPLTDWIQSKPSFSFSKRKNQAE